MGRWVFYNQSSFDGRNGTSNVVDGPARATDKQALLPGQTATFQNYTSYSKGINGIMVDVANFEGSITEDDWIIRVGNSSDVSTWQLAPEPDFVTEYVGSGVNGSIRLEVGWDNNQIQNEWVQFTLKANENTGLAADDVFYFGNAIGDTGNSPTDAVVDAADVIGAQNNHTAAAAITNLYDFNRDKVVDATDEQIAQENYSGSSPLLLITAPGTPGSGASLQNVTLASSPNSATGGGEESALVDPVAPTETPVTESIVARRHSGWPRFHLRRRRRPIDRNRSMHSSITSSDARPRPRSGGSFELGINSSRNCADIVDWC